MVTTLLLAPPYTTKNFTWVTVSMLYPRHCGDNRNCPAPSPCYSPAIPVGRGAVDTNDWCIRTELQLISNHKTKSLIHKFVWVLTLTMLDSFMTYTLSQFSSAQLAGFQLLAFIYKQCRKQCRSWSAGFSEAS